MEERTVSRVEEWDAQSFPGGYESLRQLSDAGFSGAVRTRSGTWAFLLNGRVIGVFEGTIEDFADEDGTVHDAPHPSLPLLFTMHELGGEQQAKYYTNDTPISEAHRQLSDASFTGYIELSENVLSGDYYVVYYGGRSMSCAFVGNAERLFTGDEAFERADDEVGIYEVRSVDIEVVEIPEPSTDPDPAEPSADPGPAGSAADPDPAEPADRTGAQPGERPAEGSQKPGAGRQEQPSGQQPRANHQPRDQRAGGDQPERPADRRQDPGQSEQPANRQHDHGQPPGQGAPSEQPPSDQAPGSADTANAATDDHRAPPDDPGAGAATAPDDHRQEPTDARRDGPPAETGVRDEPASERRGAGHGGAPADSAGERPPDAEQESGRPADGASAGTSEASTANGEARRSTGEDHAVSTGDRAAGDSAAASGSAGARPSADAGTDSQRQGSAGGASGPEDAASRQPTPGTTEGSSATAGPTAVSAEQFETTQLVPSLDPDRTGVAEAGDGSTGSAAGSSGGQPAAESTAGDATGTTSGSGDATAGAPGESPEEPASSGSRSPEEATGGAVRSTEADRSSGEEAVDAAVAADASAGDLRAQLDERQERIEELEAQLADLRVQRDGLRDERDRLRGEVEQLEAEIVDLQEEVDGLRSQLNDGIEGKRRLDPEEALRGTNLFVRYGSKSGGTLEKAHAGDVGKEEVDTNLRLEYHTQFEADDIAVDGEPFEQFLEGSLYKEFVDWLVHDLLYEIRDTGHVKGLKDLYDALPKVDRAELLGQVSVEYTEDGEQYREQRTFDVVLRNRMGHPLVVADINDSRNPATRGMMTGVIENASDVKESNDSLASALLVTASFFEPGALEAADEAAGGGLLGGSSRESFVRLSRKRGYHLLLVETRGGEFHVNVPEL